MDRNERALDKIQNHEKSQVKQCNVRCLYLVHDDSLDDFSCTQTSRKDLYYGCAIYTLGVKTSIDALCGPHFLCSLRFLHCPYHQFFGCIPTRGLMSTNIES